MAEDSKHYAEAFIRRNWKIILVFFAICLCLISLQTWLEDVDSEVTSASARNLLELKDDDEHPMTASEISASKLQSATARLKNAFSSEDTSSKLEDQAVESLKFMAEVGATKYRVHNVRFVFLGIAWIFILATTIGHIYLTFRTWVIPQYQALQMQVMLMVFALAFTPSLELLSRRTWLFDIVEVFLQGQLLMVASIWLPRALERLIAKVRLVQRTLDKPGDKVIHLGELEKNLHAETYFSFDFSINPSAGYYHRDDMELPEFYTVKVCAFILFVLRPLICILFVSDTFASVLPKSKWSLIMRGIIDCCFLWSAVSLATYGGKPLFKQIPTQLKMDRINMCVAHCIVLVQPLMDVILQSVSPDIILGMHLADLIEVCLVGLACSLVAANRKSNMDVTAYMAEMLENLKSGESLTRRVALVFDPLLPFHSLKVPKHGWVAVCHTLAICLQHEERGVTHWPHTDDEVPKPLMPFALTPKEEQMWPDLVRRNTWYLVIADSFTLRQRSTLVNMGIISMFMTLLIFKDEFFDFQALAPLQMLGLQLILGVVVWFLAGILLIGNNIFIPKYPYFVVSSILWSTMMLLCFVLNISRFMHPFNNSHAQVTFEEAVLGPDFRMWIHLVMAILSLVLLMIVYIRYRLPDRYSDFLGMELRSLMYTTALLEPRQALAFPTVGARVEVRREGVDVWEEARVTKTLGNGFYEAHLDKAVNGLKEITVLRKEMRPLQKDLRQGIQGGHLINEDESQMRHRLKAHFASISKPFSIMPPILMLSMVMSLVIVTAFSAVMADSATRVFLVVNEMHDLAVIGGNYFRNKTDCNETGYRLAEAVDLDSSQSISHDELPLYSLVRSLPAGLRDRIASKDQLKVLWPAKNDDELLYSQVGEMLCKAEAAGKYSITNTHGLGGLFAQAQHVNLTGERILEFYGGSVSKMDFQATVFENIAPFGRKIVELAENVLDTAWPKFDYDHSGYLNLTEARVVALGLNFLLGRAPIILGLVPCPRDVNIAPLEHLELGPLQTRRLQSYLSPIAHMVSLSDVNHDGILQKTEWLKLVAALTWMPGLSWGKKFLTKAFDFLAGPAAQLEWEKVFKIANALDAFIATGANLPKMIKEKKASAMYFKPFLDDNKDGKLTRDEMDGFKNFLSEAKSIATAERILDRAFLDTDADGNGILEGQEMESKVFGLSLEHSIGQLSLQDMEKSVASTPANCKSMRTHLQSEAPSRSLLGQTLVDLVDHAEGRPNLGADSAEDEAPETWSEAAARHLLMSAPLPTGSSTIPKNSSTMPDDTPKNIYELASDVKQKAKAAKEGVESTLNFFKTLQEVSSPKKGSVIDGILKTIASEKIRIAIWWITVGVVVSNIASDMFAIFICYMLSQKFTELTDYFRKGENYRSTHPIKGVKYLDDSTHAGTIRNSFSSSTYLPGTMWFTIILGWITCFVFFNVAWIAAVIGIIWPGDTMYFIFPYAKYFCGSLAVSFLLRFIVMDHFIVDNGDVTRPRLFTLVWMMLVVINFVLGVSLAVLRIAFLTMYALVSGCFLHFSLMDERLLRLDTGYFGFFSMAYTYYERHNPVKCAFTSVVAPQVHRLFGPAVKRQEGGYSKCCEAGQYENMFAEEDDDEEATTSHILSYRKLRAKTRFALALTLARNPEIIPQRRARPQDGDKDMTEDLTEDLTSGMGLSSESDFTETEHSSARRLLRIDCGSMKSECPGGISRNGQSPREEQGEEEEVETRPDFGGFDVIQREESGTFRTVSRIVKLEGNPTSR